MSRAPCDNCCDQSVATLHLSASASRRNPRITATIHHSYAPGVQKDLNVSSHLDYPTQAVLHNMVLPNWKHQQETGQSKNITTRDGFYPPTVLLDNKINQFFF